MRDLSNAEKSLLYKVNEFGFLIRVTDHCDTIDAKRIERQMKLLKTIPFVTGLTVIRKTQAGDAYCNLLQSM